MWISVWHHVLSAWRTSFSIFYKPDLPAGNSLRFYLFGPIPSQFWQVVSLVIRQLVESLSGLLSAEPPAPRSSGRNRSLRKLPENLKCWTHALLSCVSPKERLPSDVSSCQLYHGSSGAASTLPSSVLLPLASRHLEDATALQRSETGQTEGRPSGRSPRRVPMLDYCPVFSFSPQRASGSWDFLPKCMTSLQGRGYGERVSGIFLLALVWLALPCLQCKRLSKGFWISHKGNRSMYC